MKFEALYDESCDHLVLRQEGSQSYDCHMIHPNLVIDFDENDQLVAIEFLDTSQLQVMNPLLSKEFFKDLKEVEVIIETRDMYRVAMLSFEINGQKVLEKVSLFEFEQPIALSV